MGTNATGNSGTMMAEGWAVQKEGEAGGKTRTSLKGSDYRSTTSGAGDSPRFAFKNSMLA